MATKEELLKKVGSFGVFQKRTLVSLYFLGICCSGVVVLSGVFVVYTPPHRCYIPGIDDNETFTDLQEGLPEVTSVDFNTSFNPEAMELSRFIPIENGSDGDARWSQCYQYKTSTNYSAMSNNNSVIVACQNGWKYFDSTGVFTATMEFSLVCDRAWMAPLATSMQLLGFIVGSLGGGYLSDRFGRRPALIVSVSLMLTSTAVLTVLPVWELTYIAWCVMGLSTVSRALVIIVIINEMTPTKHRYLCGFFFMVAFTIGAMLIPLFAYLIPNWRHFLGFYAGLQLLSFLPLTYFVKESLPWLLQNSEEKKAIALLKYIGKVNNRELADDECLLLKDKEPNKNEVKRHRQVQRRLSYVDIVTTSFLRRRILILAIAWIAVTTSYYGLSINTNNLGGNRYLASFLSSAMEFPGSALSYFGLKKIGGRISFIIMTGISGTCLLATPSLLYLSEAAVITCNLVGKLFISGSFATMYVFVGDFFPTLLRNQSYAASSMLSRIVTMLVPYLIFLGKNYHESIPYLVLGGIAIIASVGMFFLPETRNTSLPETMEDAKMQDNLITKTCNWTKKKVKDVNHNTSTLPTDI